MHTGSQLKWITKLLQFDFEIEYKRGKENKAADTLSRMPAIELAALTLSTVRTNLLQSIMDSWEGDTTIQTIIHQLQNQSGEQKGYSFVNQQLRRKRVLVVGANAELRSEILKMWHSSPQGGHSGIDNTYTRVSSIFY